MKVKSESEVAQLCLTLWDPMDCSPPGSSAHGIFQARVLEWVAIAFSEHPFYKAVNGLLETAGGGSRGRRWDGNSLPELSAISQNPSPYVPSKGWARMRSCLAGTGWADFIPGN